MQAETIGAMLVAVNGATEGFKRVISRYNIDEQSKAALYFLFALLAGLFVAFSTNAAPELFDRTLLAKYPMVGNAILGLALGYGSKATYFIMDLLANLREFAKLNSASTSVIVSETATTVETAAPASVVVKPVKADNTEAVG